MPRMLLSILILAFIVPFSAQVAAQSPADDAPIVFNSAGDLWRYDPATDTLEALTQYGYNETPILSGASGLVAYASVAKVWIDAGVERSGPAAKNIWVIDPQTSDAFRAADQPADASLALENFVYRSDPAWSPDGLYLTWTNYLYNPGAFDSYSVSIFDVEARTEQVYPLPFDVSMLYGIPSPLPIAWSPDGAYLAIPYERRDESGNALQIYAFFDPEMQPVSEVMLEIEGFPRDERWLNHQGAVVMGAYVKDDGWYLIDPVAQTVESYQGVIVGSTAADGGQIIYDAGLWWLANGDTTLPLAVDHPTYAMGFDYVALAPDGQAVAYQSANGTFTLMDADGNLINTVTPADDFYALRWGEMHWSTAE